MIGYCSSFIIDPHVFRIIYTIAEIGVPCGGMESSCVDVNLSPARQRRHQGAGVWIGDDNPERVVFMCFSQD